MQTEHSHTSNQEQPLVSFIITYYNLPIDLLRLCLDSILSLSLRANEKEIILIDDGSENSPLPMLEDYGKSIVYVRQSNGGLSEARNTGIRISTGQYIQFVDGDDQLIRNSYEHCLDMIRSTKPDVLLFEESEQEEEMTVFDDTAVMSGPAFMRSHNLRGSACGYLFRKAILGELRFTPGIYHEDEEFTPLLMLRADSMISTNAKAYLYRKRNDSIMTATNLRHRLKRLNDSKRLINHLNKMADTLPTELRLALQRRVHQLTMDYIYNVILLTQNRHYLNRRLKDLHAMGLYPLPKHDYTKKYVWFRRLANTDMGISMLMRAIPLIKK